MLALHSYKRFLALMIDSAMRVDLAVGSYAKQKP